MKKSKLSQARRRRARRQFFQASKAYVSSVNFNAINLNGMRLRDIPFALALAFGSLSTHADPVGGSVAAGQAAISAMNGVTTVQQMSDRAIVNWQSFNVNAGEAVKFVQPSSTAAILNRVTGGTVSNISGLLEGNGRVYLINPNGIVVGANGVVNVNGGFVASTQGIADSAFMQNGALIFTGESTGSIQVLGKVQSTQGDIILIAPKVAIENTAELIAGQNIKLVAANEVELSNGKLTVKPKADDAGQITVEGALTAAQVQLKANNNNLGALAINTSGRIHATGTQTNPDGSVTMIATGQGGNLNLSGNVRSEKGDGNGGAVTILADNGIRISGTINANSSNANSTDTSKKGGDIYIGRDVTTNKLTKATDVSGATLLSNQGFVETSGDWLKTNNITVLAKDWLLDPTNIRIVGSGSTTAASSNVGGTAGTTTFNGPSGISDSLVFRDDIQNAINAGTNVKIDTANSTPGANGSGNITIETALTFNNNTANAATLSLLAKNGITQNAGASITNNGSGLVHVVMTAEGLPGGTPITLGTSNTSSLGITLNSTIKTNGDVTITGTTANSGQHGVRFSNGSGIDARSYNVTGRMTANSGGSQGAAQGSGVVFTGTSAFKSTADSTITASTGSTAVYGMHFHNGSTVTFDTGGAKLVAATDAANLGSGVKIGWAGGAVINTLGDVTLGSLNANAFMHLQGTVNASGNSVNTVGSLKLLGQSSNGGIASQDGGGVSAKVIATGATSIDIEGVSTGAAHGVNLGITIGSPISSQTGNINIKGSTTTASGFNGVNVMNNTSITSTSGNIAITGNSASNTNAAVRLNWGTLTTGGNVIVVGTSTVAGALGVWNDNFKVTGSNVTVAGTSVSAAGVHLGNGVDASVNGLFEANGTTAGTGLLTVTGVSQSGTGVQTQSGTMKATKDINIDASSGSGTGLIMTGTNGTTSSGGNVNIKTDSLNLATTAVGITSTSGLVSIQNKTAGTLINLGGSDVLTGTKVLGITNAELNKIAASRTEIGSATAGDLTVSSAVTSLAATGHLSLISGRNIGINAALNVGGATGTKNLTLNAAGASSAVTQNVAGVIKASGLELLGANATYTLTNTGNTVTNLVGNTGAVNYTNNGALVIGKGATGVATTGLTTKNGVSVTTQTGDLSLNEAISNSTAGDIKIEAKGNGSIGSTLSGVRASITQNANRFVFLTTEGNGNITSADIINNGNKDVIIAAGNNLLAGNGAGGQVLAGGSVTQGSTGKLFVYSGNAAATGALTSLSGDFSTLKVTGDATQNADTNFAYNAGAGITDSTANAQVMFREKVTITNGLVGTTLDTTYGNTNTQTDTAGVAALLADTKAKLKSETGNSGSASVFNTTTGGSGNNNIQISKSVIIDSLSGTLDAPTTNTSGSHIAAVEHSYGTFTSSKYTLDPGAIGAVKVNVAKLALTGAIANSTTTYGNSLAVGAVSLTNKVGNDNVGATGVTINTTGNTSTSGHLKAGSYTGIQSVSGLTGTDADNYSFANVKGDYTVNKLALNGTIATSTTTYGSVLSTGAATLTNKISGDIVDVNGVTINTTGNTSTSGHLKAGSYTGIQSVSGLTGTDADNYSFANVKGDYTVNKLALNGTIATSTTTYGSDLVSGAATLTNKISGDIVDVNGVTINTTGNTSTSGHLKAGSYTGIQSVSGLTGTDADNYSFANVKGDYTVNKLALNGSISRGNTIYGDNLAAGTVNLNKVGNDNVGATGVTINTTGNTSTSGHLKAGSYTGIQSVNGITGTDADNYTLANVTGDYFVATKAVFVNAVATTRNFNGAQQTQSDPVKVGFIDGDVVNIKGVAKGTAVGRYQSALALDGGADADNYDVKFTNAALVIDYGGVIPPNQPQRYVPLASDTVNLAPVTFAMGVAPATAAGDEADPNVCYAWGQRNGGDVVVHTVLKPTYLGLRNAKTDTQEAASNSSGATSHAASQCGQDASTKVSEADNI